MERIPVRPPKPGPELGKIHAALASQITEAGETIDRKVSQALAILTAREAPQQPEAGQEPDLPRFSRESIARESAILDDGLRNEPERFLNLVHGIPKAGNSSLLATLWNSPEIIGGAMSSHFLSATALRAVAASADKAARAIHKFEHARNRRTRMILGELGYLADWLRPPGSPPPTNPLKVVCPFREPVASALSLGAYRQSVSNSIREAETGEPYADGRSVDNPEGFAFWMQAWVEHELKGLYGFDFLSHPFDAERGYTVYAHGPIRLLVITLESMGSLPDAIAELYGCDQAAVRPVKSNDAGSRQDAARYRRQIEEFRMTAAMAGRVYSSPLMRHLYTEDQRGGFIARWTTGTR